MPSDDPSPRADRGIARLRDSARREWLVEPRRDPERGRILVVSPAHGDLEPFRASADHFAPDRYLQIDDEQWSVFARLVERPDDPQLQAAAFRAFDGMVRAAQHQSLLGAAEDDDD
jgi:hypothetical protein